jgi:UDP-glucose 4-epimerase
MHFSAFAYVGESVTNPEKYYLNNVAATLNLLSAMKRHNVKRFIFSSSCATFGNPQYIPIDEQHPQNPINPYGATKLMVERILSDYSHAYGLSYAALRYFNAAGAHPSGKIGESHNPETHIIPLILKAIKGENPVIKILGTDYDTADGTCVRDYIHVCDLAAAHRLALEKLLAVGPADEHLALCVNLGTGKGTSVKELIAACEEVSGKKAPVEYAGRRAGDPPRLVASNEYARNVLHWEPEWTDIRKIVETAWKWELAKRY